MEGFPVATKRAKMTNEDLLDKIDWEGGISGAIDYGIKGWDIVDPKVAKAWKAAEKARREFEKKVRVIEVALGLEEGDL